MGEKTKVITKSPDGQNVEIAGEDMRILDTNEPWAEYTLEDGAKICIKNTIISIVKTDRKNEDGSPLYFIQSQPVVKTIPRV